jgi:hypothetical protein
MGKFTDCHEGRTRREGGCLPQGQETFNFSADAILTLSYPQTVARNESFRGREVTVLLAAQAV